MSTTGAYAIKEIKVDNPEELMREYKRTGNITIRNQLVMHYIQHVNVAIYSMRSILLSNIPFEDFFHQGVLALIECIERYEPDRGVATFDTYSYTGIRGSILKYLRKQNWLPNRLWEARKNINRGKAKLEQELMREPTQLELAQHLQMTEEKLSKLSMEIAVVDTVSFEKLLQETFGTGLPTALKTDRDAVGQDMFRQELLESLGKAIESLQPSYRQIITLYYYENLNSREIGEVLSLTQQRISQKRKKALTQLREFLKDYDYQR